MTAPAVLEASLRVERGDFTARVSLALAAGEVLALLGPNGAGKSTILNALAGLVPIEEGTVGVGGRIVGRVVPGERTVSVPPEGRDIGLLGQDPRLFPHLSVRANVAFGPRARGVAARDADAEAGEWLSRVGLAGLGGRRPSELSGGQQQRAAIARALAARPRVLLLDEPFASLDVETAPAVRRVLAEQLRASRTSAIIVSHDVVDAVVLAGRMAVLDGGRIVDEGPTSELLAAPRTPFAAAIAGLNLVRGTSSGEALVAAGGLVLRGRDSAASVPTGLPDGSPVSAVFAPAAVRVSAGRPAAGQAFPVRIESLTPTPGGVRVHGVAAGALSLLADVPAAAALALAEGVSAWFAIEPADVVLHSAPPRSVR